MMSDCPSALVARKATTTSPATANEKPGKLLTLRMSDPWFLWDLKPADESIINAAHSTQTFIDKLKTGFTVLYLV